MYGGKKRNGNLVEFLSKIAKIWKLPRNFDFLAIFAQFSQKMTHLLCRLPLTRRPLLPLLDGVELAELDARCTFAEVVAIDRDGMPKFMGPMYLLAVSGDVGAEDEADSGELLRLEPVELGVLSSIVAPLG